MISNIVVKHNSNRNNRVPQRTPLYVSPLMSDNTSLPSTAAADITISGTNSSLEVVVPTSQVPLPLPSAPRLSQLTMSPVSSPQMHFPMYLLDLLPYPWHIILLEQALYPCYLHCQLLLIYSHTQVYPTRLPD